MEPRNRLLATWKRAQQVDKWGREGFRCGETGMEEHRLAVGLELVVTVADV